MHHFRSRPRKISKRKSLACIVCVLLPVTLAPLGSSVEAAVSTELPSDSTGDAPADSISAVASTHFETGLALYGLGHFEDAVSEFRKAYEVQARPEFLLHIGRSFEKLGQSDKAQYFFKRYLSTAPPQAAERDEARAYVLKFDRDQPAPIMQEPPVASLKTPSVASNSELKSEPLWQRWWFWATAGLVVTAAVGVVVLFSRGEEGSAPQSDLGHMRF
jgi:hypothetical protein